ncbi:MAG: ribbon-helix-helix protein, CopG family [Chloroflexi bacterium]|nr:ribbon-helix-helix protein, CopG family [Chloroflexota bacterium]
MRTTIKLPDDLLARAKERAATRQTTLNVVVEDALRAALASRDPQRDPVPIPTHAGGRLQAGVDLDDTSALLDLMDGSRP